MFSVKQKIPAQNHYGCLNRTQTQGCALPAIRLNARLHWSLSMTVMLIRNMWFVSCTSSTKVSSYNSIWIESYSFALTLVRNLQFHHRLFDVRGLKPQLGWLEMGKACYVLRQFSCSARRIEHFLVFLQTVKVYKRTRADDCMFVARCIAFPKFCVKLISIAEEIL